MRGRGSDGREERDGGRVRGEGGREEKEGDVELEDLISKKLKVGEWGT